MKLARIWFVMILAAAPFFGAIADDAKLPAELRQKVMTSDRFTEHHEGAKLPAAVRALVADRDGKLANPGESWQVTDVIGPKPLPGKRLIWFATDGTRYVVHYERGGIAHSFHVLVVEMANDSAKPAKSWFGMCRGALKDFAAFREAMKAGKLEGRREYGH